MNLTPTFPTSLHKETAEWVRDYFLTLPTVDTILIVNSCARGQAVPESDLDFAILVKPGTTTTEIRNIENQWQNYYPTQSLYSKYKESGSFAHLHLDIIDGKYQPVIWDEGGGPDFFEIEIGNHICYSAPLDKAGEYFLELQKLWLPYYSEELRLKRLSMSRNACEYDLDHVPFFIKRGLYFHAFDKLYKAFQEFLQTLFIANRTYPIAYNKWIKEQIEKWLNMPELYPKLPAIISVNNIESNEVYEKAEMLRGLLSNLTHG